MLIDFLLAVFEKNNEKNAIVWKDKTYSYAWLLERINYWQNRIQSENIEKGKVVVLEADFSPNSIALFLALMEHACILVPLTRSIESQQAEFIEIAQAEISFSIDDNDHLKITKLPNVAHHEFYTRLKTSSHAGLVLFSSGSTGKSKAAVHDLVKLLEKFKIPRYNYITLTFLLYDHIGGLETMFYTLSNGGCIVTAQTRSPDRILERVEKYKVELLPVSPTFINLILLSESYKRYDLSSLKIVTYGTEPMPESTLARFQGLFPHIKLIQKYGLSELGILRSKSKSSNSLWVKVGGEGFQTRVVEGILQIKASSAMLGYLNAPTPFIEDGWFNTKDVVEIDGEYLKILGRQSEIINVGGEKVYPAEVESVIQSFDNVAEVTVYGEQNAITGNIVCAKVRLLKEEDKKPLTKRLKHYCREHLQNYKVPVKVKIVEEKQYSERFKKIRQNNQRDHPETPISNGMSFRAK
ncbi:MAG: long-chain fatty acid--CoA ligase [Candidatus Parabeggiatoa sp. nov. 2]|nr:MAG: AMP-dependent synthetase [Beggiatoa sp. 4572_84]RKZ56008.1 MAG: long-chain fatty acid--CoA ligase [Gammaproteobacteria bacterium]